MARYLDPTEFLNEIVKSKEKDELTLEAVNMIVKIANESSKKLKYKDDDDRKDCIAFGIEAALKYWRSFNPEKSKNAFAYFTQVIKHGFANGFNRLHPIKATNRISIREDGGLHNF